MILFLHSQNLMAHAKVIQANVAQDHVYSIPVNQKMSVFKQPVSKLASILGTSHFNHSKVSAGRSEAKRNLACEILSDSQAAWGFWCWDVRQRHTNTQ